MTSKFSPLALQGQNKLFKMCPLIYIHQGYSWYVPLALRNGKRFWSEHVHFIGDAYGCMVARVFGLRASPINKFSSSASKFSEIYQHHSELGVDFELFCIRRWFILMEFMQLNGLQSAVYIDTDVLLTKSIKDEIARTNEFGMTYTGYSAHICVINRLESLERFCQWIVNLYINPRSPERFQDWHQHMIEYSGGGGVSDMTLFHWFQKEYPDELGDYPAIFGESPFDVSLEEIRGFQQDPNGFKLLSWNDGSPSAVADDRHLVSLALLHHQGRAKNLLKSHAMKLGDGRCMGEVVAPTLDYTHRALKRIRTRSESRGLRS